MNNRPEFTEETQQWLCEQIDAWYLNWKELIVSNHETHSLGLAKERLKDMICGETY